MSLFAPDAAVPRLLLAPAAVPAPCRLVRSKARLSARQARDVAVRSGRRRSEAASCTRRRGRTRAACAIESAVVSPVRLVMSLFAPEAAAPRLLLAPRQYPRPCRLVQPEARLSVQSGS